MITDQQAGVLREYVAGSAFVSIAKKYRMHLDDVTAVVARVNYNKRAAFELLRQHNEGQPVTLPPLEVRRAAAPKAKVPAAVAPAVAGDDDAATGGPVEADTASGPVETPRRTDPRPAADALVSAAVVGGDDADEEVAESVATGAATTLPEQAPAVLSPAAGAALADAVLLTALESRALWLAQRTYCRSCVRWGPALGLQQCLSCGGLMEPVYLATIPREIP